MSCEITSIIKCSNIKCYEKTNVTSELIILLNPAIFIIKICIVHTTIKKNTVSGNGSYRSNNDNIIVFITRNVIS